MKSFFKKVNTQNNDILLRILIKYEIINKLKNSDNIDDVENMFKEKLNVLVLSNRFFGDYGGNPYFYKDKTNHYTLLYSLNNKRYKIKFYKK